MSRPFASSFLFRMLFAIGVLVAVACGGSTSSPLTGKCVESACSLGSTWDSLTCSCVAKSDAGCPESAVRAECQAGAIFDPLTCACVTPATDAGSGRDATMECPPVECAIGYVPGPGCSCVPNPDAGCVPPPIHCVNGYVYDPSTCSCAPTDAGVDTGVDAGLDAGCPETPANCAIGYVFDPSSCSCVPSADAGTCNGEVCGDGGVCCGRFGCFPSGHGCPG
jgi:hypothetical protein